MKRKSNLTTLFVADLIVLAALWLTPDPAAFLTGKRILMALLAAVALILLVLISRRREVCRNVQILSIDDASRINPNQYLSKGGPVCAGSDSKYHVVFLLPDDTRLTLSLSARQAGALAKGMRGTLAYRDSVFISFAPE